MKKFQFPLDRVLQWRLEQVDLEEGRLRQLLAERAAVESRRDALMAERRENERQVLSGSTVPASDLAALDAFRMWVRNQNLLIEARLRDCDARIDQQRQAVLEARRKQRLLEKLKDRYRAGWQFEFDREQEALAAEMHLAGLARNR